MPRLPFTDLRQFTTVFAFTLATCALGPNQAFAAPTAVIQASATTGPAPFAVHVHGLNSTLGVGDENTARYEWDFGDPVGGAYNTMDGWNAAHIYDQPGTYTLNLKVTNQAGQQSSKTIPITINPANRVKIYVSPFGSDANNGLSPSTPIKTVAKAATMIGNNRAILFERGGWFDVSSTVNISQDNVLWGAYGAGSLPVLSFVVNANFAGILNLTDTANDVVIEDIHFDSLFTPNNLIVRAVHPHGQNVTVRNCHFGKVSYAMNTGAGAVQQLLAVDNTADEIGAYFSWAEGVDHTYIGNTVAGSVDEHIIRLGSADRVNISFNDFTNDLKSTIWCMLGDHCYIANNVLREGRVILGPNHALGSPSERFQWVVFENNEMFDQGMILYSGAEYIMVRNNVFDYSAGDCIYVWGYLAAMNRTCKNVHVYNNTGFNDSTQWGRFLRLGDGAENIFVRNNLYCATNLNSNNSAHNVKSDDGSLATQSFQNNLWATPTLGVYPHSTAAGGQTVTQWANYAETVNESYRVYVPSDIDLNYVPQFDATSAIPVAGVFTDFYGDLRPASGEWSAGAVEIDSTPGGKSDPGVDLNADGAVNSLDLIMLIGAWGPCSSCAADITSNGVVDVLDLMKLIAGWG